MMTVKDIFDFLNMRFPIETACDYDNPGILLGNPNEEVSNALICLDCTKESVKVAKENNCQLIITHHPVIFNGIQTVLSDSVVGIVLKNNLSVISMHTNMDMGNGGVNDCLCEILGIQNLQPVTMSDGCIIRKGNIAPISADELARFIRSKLGGRVKYVGCDYQIKNPLICSGSGGDYINEVAENGCDALITSDVKHNYFVDAVNLGIPIFDAGHFETEEIIVEPLSEMLTHQFKTVNFKTFHPNDLKYV